MGKRLSHSVHQAWTTFSADPWFDPGAGAHSPGMDRSVIDHLGTEFAALGAQVVDGLKSVFKTSGPVWIYPLRRLARGRRRWSMCYLWEAAC